MSCTIRLPIGHSDRIAGGANPHPYYDKLCEVLGNARSFSFWVQPTINREVIELTMFQVNLDRGPDRERHDEPLMRLHAWMPYRTSYGHWVRFEGIAFGIFCEAMITFAREQP